MSALVEGQRLSERFSLHHRLGRGGIGETWLARDHAVETRVALKVLDPEVLAVPEVAHWLSSELPRLRGLTHPRLVAVSERLDLDGHSAFCMDYFAGEDFDRFRGKSWREILAALAPVLEALTLAHEQGWVHGGLKASNLLCDATGRVALADLGFAGLVYRCPGARARALDRATAGCSPQILGGAQPVAADDVYALGALLYEWISGRPPFRAGLRSDDRLPRLLAPMTARTRRGDPIPDALEQLVGRMLAEAPTDRPSGVASVCTALAEIDDSAISDPVAVGQRDDRDDGPPIWLAPVEPQDGEAVELKPLFGAAVDDHRIGIEPVDLGSSAARPLAAGPGGRGESPLRKLMLAALATMLLGAIGVFFLLPRAVESRLERQAQRAREALDAEPSPLAAAESEAAPGATGRPSRLPSVSAAPPDLLLLARQRDEAREALAEIARKQEALAARSVTEWAAEEYAAAQLSVAAGEALLNEREYARAAAALKEALGRLVALESRAAALLQESLHAGALALSAGNAEEATSHYSLAVKLDPENAKAQRGLARAERIDEVFALLRAGEREEADGELERARENYGRAAEIDPDLERARADLARIDDRIAEVRHQESLSRAFAALRQKDFETARQAFAEARKWRPESDEASEGLAAATQELRLASIARLRKRAIRLESEERWREAAEQYEAVLALDPVLAFAQEGKARASRLAVIAAALDAYLDDPERLASPQVHERAVRVLAQAAAVPDPGPRLQQQIAVVGRLVELAGEPIRVELESDLQTEVVVYRVGRLGSFDRRQLKLRPGTYTAVGTREGYRDVRKRFTVRPGGHPAPVVVRCEERI
jgi:tetratricopeptide (TPR) repeat protein